MLKNYLKIAIRNLLKRKAFTVINILGLASGMAICLLILLFIHSELGYDDFQVNGDQVYRMVLDRKYPGRSTSYSMIPPSIGQAVKHEFPEVRESTRLFDISGGQKFFVKIGEKVFEESRVLSADSNFFRVFTARIIAGDTATALEKQNSVVLSESTAKRYFGSAASALGKSIESDQARHFLITGVVADWPENSHFRFDLLIASAGFVDDGQFNYTGFSAHTYLLLNKNASPQDLEAKFPLIIKKYVSGEIERSFGVTYQQFQAAGNGYHYYLQPLKRIHLISDLEGELRPNGSMKAVYVFSIIAVFILFIACINFINLSTARSVERAKEVGIRKTFGSEKKSLISQFLMESVLISLLSIVAAGVLMFLLLPLFNRVSGKELSLEFFITPPRVILLVLFSIAIGLIAGLYPAFVLSSFKPILVLKGKFKSNRYGLALRNGLVIFQFSISVILIICTVIVNRQMRFMLGEKLGFSKGHIIEIERTELLAKNTRAFRNDLIGIQGVEKVSGSTSLPGTENFFGVTFQAVGSKEPMTGRLVVVDDQYASVLKLQQVSGRFFSRELPTDSLAVVLNEKAVAELGLKNPLGARLTTTDPNLNGPDSTPKIFTVVGVVRDFHFQSLHQKITPLVLTNGAKFGDVMPITAVRIQADHFEKALLSIESTWKHFIPDRPFHYNFLDQNLADQYLTEQTTQRVFTILSVLAIFIACMGLLGLAAYATQQRLREISIRKVLGASVINIIGMLSVDFLKLVLVSALLAFPIAWWAMHLWLEDFAYRVNISWWVFLTAGVLAAGIALVTISFQAIRAAFANPVESLRNE